MVTGDLQESNITADAVGGKSYIYDGVPMDRSSSMGQDAEGRICAVSFTVSGTTFKTGYLYNAEGARVARAKGSPWRGTIANMSCDPAVSRFQATTIYILGPSGEQLTELSMDSNGNATPQRSYVYADGQLMASYDFQSTSASNPYGLRYRLTDWLGNMRATTDNLGVLESTCTNLPFGDGLSCTGPVSDAHHFTGKERDTESGNDYMEARYYGSSMGRFMSPDPLGPWVANAADPQSWNMYAYGRNNPLINVDPTGLDCINFNSSGGVSGITPTNSTQTLNTQASNCGNNGGNWVNGTVDPNNIVPNGQGGFNVSSSDGTNVYYTTMTAPGQQADGTTCSGNCVSGYSQQSLATVDSMIVAGNLNNFMQWLPRNGTPNNPGAQYPLSPWIQAADLQLLGSFTNYCGPNGAGVPVSGNDWACAAHDYNFNKIGAGGLAPLSGPNSPNILNTDALRQADKNLVNHLDNSPEGLVIKAAFHLTRY